MTRDLLPLNPDELLSTTRSVRRWLDLNRPVERAVIEECLTLALQAPSASNRQRWQFVVVTDPDKRLALAEIYRKEWSAYQARAAQGGQDSAVEPNDASRRLLDSAQYLADHMHEVPVLVVPCISPRPEKLSGAMAQASLFGSIMPAAWSFMLAARSRGLGGSMTTLHLVYEEEAAEVLGIPYDSVAQMAMIPIAYTKGTDFKPAPRIPLDRVVHWDTW